MKIINQFLISIYRFDEYNKLAALKGAQVFIYELILFTVTTIISLVPILFIFTSSGGTEGIIKKFVPDFKIENGTLEANSNVFNENGTLIIVDGKNTRSEFDLKGSANGIIFDKEKIIINNGLRQQIVYYNDLLKELGINKFEKADIFKYVSEINIFLGIFISIGILTLIISETFGIFFTSILAIIINLFLKKNIKYPELLKISVYSRTLYLILSAILALFGIGLDFIFIAVLNIAYLFFAIKKI